MTRTQWFLLLAALILAAAAHVGAQGKRRRQVHVKIWDAQKAIDSHADLGAPEDWRLIEPDSPADYAFKGDAVLENTRLQTAFLSQKGEIVLYSKAPETKTRKRISLLLLSNKGEECRSIGSIKIAGNAGSEAVLHLIAKADGRENVAASFRLARDSAFVEVKPIENAGAVRIRCRSRFLVIPEPFGDDTVYDAFASPGRLRLPSEGLLVSFLDGQESILFNTWPPGGENRVEATPSGEGDSRRFETLEISFNGKSVFAALLDAPDIWHVERVNDPKRLDKDLPLDWQRPFDASWRADFCGEDGTDSWAFEPERSYRWSGRFARRITYPCWFDGDNAFLRLVGRDYLGWALIYPFDRSKKTPLEIYSLDDIMRDTIGMGICEYVLDKEKTKGRTYLHGGVCDATSAAEHFFMRGVEGKEPEVVASLVDDAVDLITRSRERVEKYRGFAGRVMELCRGAGDASPALKALAAKLERWAGDVEKICAEERDRMKSPQVAAGIGAQIKALAKRSDPENLGQCMMLGRELRVIQSSHEVIMARVRKAVSRIRQISALAAGGDPEAAKLGEKIRKIEREMIGAK